MTSRAGACPTGAQVFFNPRLAVRREGREGLQLPEQAVAGVQGPPAGAGGVPVLVPRKEPGDCLVRTQLLLQAYLNN